MWQGTYHEEGAFLYPEWDYQRHLYRKHWCAVREKELAAVHDDFVSARPWHVMGARSACCAAPLRAMRDEDRLMRKREKSGDDVDIDALVEALADAPGT